MVLTPVSNASDATHAVDFRARFFAGDPREFFLRFKLRGGGWSSRVSGFQRDERRLVRRSRAEAFIELLRFRFTERLLPASIPAAAQTGESPVALCLGIGIFQWATTRPMPRGKRLSFATGTRCSSCICKVRE